MDPLQFRVLGPLEAVRDGVALRLGGPRPRALLAALLLAGGRPVRMDSLLDAVWADTPPDTAVKTIQKYVSLLRTELNAPGLIVSLADGYELGAPDVDSRRFESLIDRAESESAPDAAAAVLTEALALWRGEPYPDLPDLAEAQAERRRLDERRLSAIEALAEARLALGQYGPLIGWVEQILAAHPLRERLWGVLMLALYRSGRQAEALAAFQRLRTTLIEELGAEPTPALCALHDRILRQDDDVPPRPITAARTPRPSTIPLNLTGFVGREAELDQLAALLERQRLVTLTGSAGSGKTRLAVELLSGAMAERPGVAVRDGAWFVELAGLRDPERIPAVVAGVLRLQEQPGRAIEDVLLDTLAGKSLLLVLDNCEHLLDGLAELVPRWLRAAPELRALATSRQPLGVAGEYVLEVPPLPVPASDDPVEVESSEAVRLLTQRALAVDSGFRVTPANAAAVASIARRLDGMPLALELAAARMRVFDAHRLADLLDDRFRVLVSTLRTAPQRHQTLLAAIAWSYDLLSPDEQALFRALSVFEGGFTLEAAERVGGEGGAMTVLPALVERSIVVVDRRAGSNRYRLLESLREYGRAQLEPDEAHECRRRHLHWYLDLAERAEAGIRGPDYRVWLDVLNAEGDNLRAALRWSLSRERTTGIKFAAALAPYWDEATYYSEGARWLRDAIADTAGVPAELGALVLAGAARLAIGQGDHLHAAELTERSLALAQAANDQAGVVRATALRGNVALYQGNYTEAAPLLEESMAEFGRLGLIWEQSEAMGRLGHMHRLSGDYANARVRLEQSLSLRDRLGDVVGQAWVRWQLGVLARYEGDYERAARCYEKSLSIFDEIADVGGSAHVRYSMGDLARLQGDTILASSMYQASLAVLRDVGDQRCTASIQFNLGAVALDLAEPETALPLLRESLAIRSRLNDQGGIAECLEAFAGVEQANGGPVPAVRLLAAANALRGRIGAVRPSSDEHANAARVASLRAEVGGERFDEAWSSGECQDGDAVVAALLNRS